MSSFPLFAEFDFLGGPSGLVTLATVLVLMACLGILALALYGLWATRGKKSPGPEGSPQIQQAVGKQATVYVSIPGGRSGAGKIQVNLESGTMEYLAMTAGGKLSPGSKVVVVDLITPTTVEVQPVLDPERSDDE